MKLTINKSLLIKIVRILKWGKIIAKLTAIGTTVSGAITALSGSATSGIALSAAGATTYAATKGLPNQGYEKTKHIPPGRIDKTANLLRQQEIAKATKNKIQSNAKLTKMPGKTLQGGMLYAKQSTRATNSMPTASIGLTARKK